MPRALLTQDRQRRLGHPERAEEVGLDLRARLLLAHLLDRAEEAVARVVDHDVEPAEVLVCLLDGRVDRRLVGDVERERKHVLAVAVHEIGQAVGVARRGGYLVPAREGGSRPDVPEALRRPGDEPDFHLAKLLFRRTGGILRFR